MLLGPWQGTRAPPRSESEAGHSSTITSSAASSKPSHGFLFPTFLGQEAGVVYCSRVDINEKHIPGLLHPLDTCSF